MFPLKKIILGMSLVAALIAPAIAVEDVQKLMTDGQTAMLRGDYATARANLEMVRQLQPRNQTVIALLRRIEIEQAQRGGAVGAKEKVYSTIIIPKVDFREASLREALDFLKKKASEATNGRENVNFVMQLPDGQSQTSITLNLTNIPFTEALKYVGRLANVSFTYDQYAIIARPSGPAPAPVVKSE